MSTPHEPSPIEQEVWRIRELARGRRHAEALSAAEALAGQVPENRDVLYLIALSQRYLNRIPEALSTLDRLEQFHPRFSRLHQERGRCYVALRDAPRAIDALLRGVNINPALPTSWSLLEGLYRKTGDSRNAATAAQHVATLTALPPEVLTATSLFSDGNLTPAENMVRAYLLKHGNHVEAMRLLAKIGIARGVLDDADLLLEAVLTLAPDYRAARHDYALVLIERHKYLQAREQLAQLLEVEPENRQYRTLFATACVGLGEHEKAIPLYREMLVDAPAPWDLHLSIAHSLKTIGRRAEAIEAYRAAAAGRLNFGNAYWSLANLKTYRFLDQEIERMRAAVAASSTQLVDRYHLCFALGKANEDRGEYSESWHYYERGNTLKRSESRFRPEIIETNTRKQIETCTREFFTTRAGFGAPAPDPISIVGLPRAGSTLLEQILASHPRGRGHSGTLRHSAHRPGFAGPRVRSRQSALSGRSRRYPSRGFSAARRKISGRDARLPHRPAVLHRQNAEQFPACWLNSSDAAECPSSWNSPTQTSAPCLLDNEKASSNLGNCITEVKGTPYTNPFGAQGTRPAFSPLIEFNLRARYDWALSDYKRFVMAGASHIGDMSNQPASYVAGVTEPIPKTTHLRYDQPGYTTYDASLGVAKDNWTAQLYGQNLSNSDASTFTSSAQFIESEVPLRPRVLGVKFGYKF